MATKASHTKTTTYIRDSSIPTMTKKIGMPPGVKPPAPARKKASK